MEELTLIDHNARNLYKSIMEYTYKHADEVSYKCYSISERLLVNTLPLQKGKVGYKLNKDIISFLQDNYELYRKIDLTFYNNSEKIYEHNAKTGSSRFSIDAYNDYIKKGHEELLRLFCF